MKNSRIWRSVQMSIGALVGAILLNVGVVTSIADAENDFYSYSGSQPLASLPAGAVLKTRTVPYHALGLPTPVNVTQVLYRSTDALGRAVANVTSVLRPRNPMGPTKLISYQSFYDSLNVQDSPSRVFAGDAQLGGLTPSGLNPAIGSTNPTTETAFIAPLLAAGYTINIADIQGPNPVFLVGPEYGRMTLDSLRALRSVATTGVTDTTKIGLMGYSGGSSATNWAASLAPSYAPEINEDLVGAASGGVVVDPANIVRYVGGSIFWAGATALAVTGTARAYDIDLTKYLNDYGRSLVTRMQDASIMNTVLQYPGLSWAAMALPQYADLNSVPELAAAFRNSDINRARAPRIPAFIGQGANGPLEGTQPGGSGIGAGDGVTVTGDVRTMANRFCGAGQPVQYDEYALASHVTAVPFWLAGVYTWLADRFDGVPAPSNCGRIPPGNPAGT